MKKRVELIFPAYQTFSIAGIKIGIVGYNDPMTPIRQSPAYSYGIKFSSPEKNISQYISLLKEQEQCGLVLALTHMGMPQQIHLANQPYAEGLDYIFGGDTHERIREPFKEQFGKSNRAGFLCLFPGQIGYYY